MPVKNEIPDDQEVLDSFAEFIQERKKAGNLYAESVVSLLFDGSTILATFDPPRSGIKTSALLGVSPLQTLAEFIGIPVTFADEQGIRLRKRVQNVHVSLVDGQDLGSMDVAELYKIGTGQTWSPGL